MKSVVRCATGKEGCGIFSPELTERKKRYIIKGTKEIVASSKKMKEAKVIFY